MIEEWRYVYIKGSFENNTYMVSNLGRVYSVPREIIKSDGNIYVCKGGILKPRYSNKGYLRVKMHDDNYKGKNISVHRLVAIAFIPNPENLPFVNHKDENPSNNYVDNLEWCTHEYNVNYGTAIERSAEKRKNHPNMSKVVYQYDCEGNLIKEYPSQKEAERVTGIPQNNINSCCSENGNKKTVNGFVFSYTRYNNKQEFKEKHPLLRPKMGVPHTVYQYKDGVLVNTYSSTHDAAKKNGYNQSAIGKCCRCEKPHYKGYTWSYKELN